MMCGRNELQYCIPVQEEESFGIFQIARDHSVIYLIIVSYYLKQ